MSLWMPRQRQLILPPHLRGPGRAQRGFLLNPYRFGGGGGGGGGGGDPYFANVSLLLHMDGADASTTFTDSSSNAFTVTANGNVRIFPTGKFGQYGGFDGVGDYITTPTDAAFGFGAGDYTVEGWLNNPGTPANWCMFDNRSGSNQGIGIYASVNAANQNRRLVLANNTAVIVGTGTTQYAANTWTHWAVCRSGTTVRGFLDGVQAWSVTDSRTLASSAQVFIGSSYTPGQYYTGAIDDLRITKGVARYTASFTPPTAAFQDS